MSVYTISPDFLENIEDDEKSYLSDILFIFSNRSNSHKIAKDKHGVILDVYKSIKKNPDIIKIWLDLMSFTPSGFEKIDVDIRDINCKEEMSITLCKETKGTNKLIVYSVQNIVNFECIDGFISYDGKVITVFDRDDAKMELNKKEPSISSIINHSQIAGNDITKSTNK